MTIMPIVRSVTVPVAPGRAFHLFTADLGRWWSPAVHIGAEPLVEIVLEPRAGGRWYERAASGAETQWGRVLAWEPPHRLLLAWQIDASFKHDPDLVTEVEVTFEPVAGGTRLTLIHRHLERFGDSADRVRGQLSGGWPTLLDRFVQLVAEDDR